MNKIDKVIFVSLLLIGLTGGNGVVFAQALDDIGDGGVDDEAKAALRRGIELFETGAYVDAADSFRKAMSVKASWKLYYNIGQSEAAAQRYGLALEAFEAYLVSGGDNVPVEKKDEVLEEIERLRLLVGILDFKAPEGASLLIDNYFRGKTPIEGVIRVAAGPHHIVVTRNGKTIYDSKVKIAGGIATTIDAGDADNADDVHADNAAGSTSATPETESMPRLLKAGIIVGGAGVVLTGVGVIFLIKGINDDEEAQGWDKDNESEKGKIDDYNNTTLPLNKAMTVTGFVAGGLAMATGTILMILGSKKKDSSTAAVMPALGGLTVRF